MKANEIKVGGHYAAKVNGVVVTVRVDAIRDTGPAYHNPGGRSIVIYDVTNLKTGRKTTFRSAAKFRGNCDAVKVQHLNAAGEIMTDEEIDREYDQEAEHRSDPPTPRSAQSAEESGPVESVAEKTGPQGDEQRPDPTDAPTATTVHPSSQDDAAAPTAGPKVVARFPEKKAIVRPQPGPEKCSGLASKLRVSYNDRLIDTSPHLIVEARAGTGKTFTLIEGLKLLFGMGTEGVIPSPQQQAVWDAMKLSPKPGLSCFCAFNNSIAAELGRKIPQVRGCAAKTLHSLGYYAVRKAFRITEEPDRGASGTRVRETIARLLGAEMRTLRKEKSALLKVVASLVGFCKQNLVTGQENGWESDLKYLVHHYDIDIVNDRLREEAFQLVPEVLEAHKDVDRDGYVDFNDMIWIPVVHNLPILKNDILLVDESQDLNRCQQALAKMAGRRLVLVGDPRQSIYGFAGADAMSMKRMEEELSDTPRGLLHLPLTVTRRCGKAIVQEACRLVPDFQAHESNPEGVVREALYPIQKKYEGGHWTSYEIPYEESYLPQVQDGDMILCRANAPLVNQYFRFLKRGRKAWIQGRNVADSLVSLIEQMEATTIPELLQRMADWLSSSIEKENTRLHPSESRIQGFQDRYDCIVAFASEAGQAWKTTGRPQEVIDKINSIFTDNKDLPGIMLSSIHRAKGLEARRVFYIQGFGRPYDKIWNQWERDQEDNLRYVAITRAIEELVYVV